MNPKFHNSIFPFNIQYSKFRILIVVLFVGLSYAGLSAVGRTFASFNDTETSENNIYQAGTLDFSITNNNIEELLGVELGEDIEFTSILTKMTGSLDIQYKARAEKISGDDSFCDALQLEVLHSEISYDGALLSLDTATTTKLGTWAFEIKLPPAASHIAHGEKCDIDLVFEGWQTDVANYGDSGFFDEERIHIRLTSRMIVLNEFLPNPEGYEYGFDFGQDSDVMPRGEWVELYNNSDVAFDVLDWYIKDTDNNTLTIAAVNSDNNGDTEDAGETIIPGKGHLVVYDNSIFSLNNTGDTVKLFNSADTLIDSYTYTAVSDYCDIEPTPGDENTTDTSGSCAGVPPNKSYARIPDGIGDWVDPIPTPGTVNMLDWDGGQGPGVLMVETVEQVPDIEIIEQAPAGAEEISVEIQEEPVAGEQEPPVGEIEIEPSAEENSPETEESVLNIIADEIIADGTIMAVDEMIIGEEPVIIEEPTTVEQPTPEPPPADSNSVE